MTATAYRLADLITEACNASILCVEKGFEALDRPSRSVCCLI